MATACGKDKNANENCIVSTINMSTSVCRSWGITNNGNFYIAEDMPVEFQQEGLKVCVQYEIIPGPPVSCTCCVEKARITSIHKFE